VSRRYESVAAETVHGWLVDLLPIVPARVLDVGAGTGRDAAWLASRGLEIVAVEPSGAMRAEAQRLHASPSIRWITDSLPSLDRVLRLGLSFDLILLSVVWKHVPHTDRTRAFRNLVTLLKPGGCMAITLRHGPIGRVSRPETVHLDNAYLSSFGELLVPRHLWRALQRFDVWIEPALIAEWSRLTNGYAARQGRTISEDKIATAMTWSEPNRDVRIAREQAVRLLESDKLYCVWSGHVLSVETLDVDHCFPWAAWPCDDLWNLLPAHRNVNQNQKRDKLPGVELLRSAQDQIQSWWTKATWARTITCFLVGS
jgi:SAM-dependent methyltransferase